MLCACGRALHYRDERVKRMVCDLVSDNGPDLLVTIEGRTWLVQRHYIALHGVKASELPGLGFVEVGGVTAGRGLH